MWSKPIGCCAQTLGPPADIAAGNIAAVTIHGQASESRLKDAAPALPMYGV
jgi:hypothetical protein